MTRIRVQRNPSTGKVMRNSATGKVMVVDLDGSVCANCYAETTPKYLTISFSGIIDCPNCTKMGGDAWWVTYSESFAAHLNNQSFKLIQNPANECLWYYVKDGAYGTINAYLNDECAGEPDTVYTCDRLHISAAATDLFGTPKTTIVAEFYDLSFAAITFYAFFFTGNRAPFQDCMTMTKDDGETCGDRRMVSDSGTAVIVQI